MLETILVAESRSPGGGISSNTHQRAENYVHFEDEPDGKEIVVAVVEVHLVVGLEKLKGFMLKPSYRMRQNE